MIYFDNNVITFIIVSHIDKDKKLRDEIRRYIYIYIYIYRYFKIIISNYNRIIDFNIHSREQLKRGFKSAT